MAKKTATKTAAKTAPLPATDEESVAIESESEPKANPPKTAAPARAPEKPEKTGEDQPGNVGIAEIKKAVTFINSVGGLDNAIALVQIVKVAKDVQ